MLQSFLLLPLRDEVCHHSVLGGLVVLGGIFDVNFPARQPCREPHVLTFTTDRKAELIRRDQNMGMLTNGIDQTNKLDFGGTERVGDVLTGILGPTDHVDLFAAQFVHHLLDAGAPRSDAGSHRVNFPFNAVNRHFGAWSHGPGWGIGLPSDGHDPHRALLNFRNLVFEEVDHQTCIGAADEQLGAAPGNLAHLLEKHLESGVGPVVVIGQLIPAGKFGFDFRSAQSGANGHDHGLPLEADHPGGQHGILEVCEFLLNHSTLLVSQLLCQHLFGGGCGHATEVLFLRGDVENHGVSHLSVLRHLHHLG